MDGFRTKRGKVIGAVRTIFDNRLVEEAGEAAGGWEEKKSHLLPQLESL